MAAEGHSSIVTEGDDEVEVQEVELQLDGASWAVYQKSKPKSATTASDDEVRSNPHKTIKQDRPLNVLEIDFPGDFVQSCLLGIDCIQKMVRPLESWGYDKFQLIEDETHVKEVESQLKRAHIPISFVGIHNVGKSTLLNAIFCDKLLPQRGKNETGVKVYIEHSDAIHRGPCPERDGQCPRCPILRPFCDEAGENVGEVHGQKAIYKRLCELNKLTRTNREGGGRPQLLTTNVPLLKDMKGAYLCDVPGFADPRKAIASIANRSKVTSPAYVYVMSYGREDERDLKNLEDMKARDPDLFTAKRLVIAVSQFDRFYKGDSSDSSDDSDNEEEGDAKADLSRLLEERLGESSVPPGIICPVSGRWALCARRGLERREQTPNSVGAPPLPPPTSETTRSEKYLAAYKRRSTGPGGQNETPNLEEASGIIQLEESIQEIAGQSSENWKQNVKGNSLGYLEYAKAQLQLAIQRHNAKVSRVELQHIARRGWYNAIQLNLQVLEQSLKHRESPVYQKLKAVCKMELELPIQNVKEKISNSLKTFQDGTVTNCEKGYQATAFKTDVDNWLSSVNRDVADTLARVSFETSWSVLTMCSIDMANKSQAMKDGATLFGKLCALDGPGLNWSELANTEFSEFPEATAVQVHFEELALKALQVWKPQGLGTNLVSKGLLDNHKKTTILKDLRSSMPLDVCRRLILAANAEIMVKPGKFSDLFDLLWDEPRTKEVAAKIQRTKFEVFGQYGHRAGDGSDDVEHQMTVAKIKQENQPKFGDLLKDIEVPPFKLKKTKALKFALRGLMKIRDPGVAMVLRHGTETSPGWRPYVRPFKFGNLADTRPNLELQEESGKLTHETENLGDLADTCGLPASTTSDGPSHGLEVADTPRVSASACPDDPNLEMQVASGKLTNGRENGNLADTSELPASTTSDGLSQATHTPKVSASAPSEGPNLELQVGSGKLTKEQVEGTLQRVLEPVMEELQSYVAMIEEKVAQHLYEKYSKKCSEEVDQYHEKHSERIQSAWDSFQEEIGKTQALKVYIDELKHHMEWMSRLKVHITESACR